MASVLAKCNQKPQMGVMPLHIFGAKRKQKPFKRDKLTSRDFIACSAVLPPEKLSPVAWKLVRSTCDKSRNFTTQLHQLPVKLIYSKVTLFSVTSTINFIVDVTENISWRC